MTMHQPAKTHDGRIPGRVAQLSPEFVAFALGATSYVEPASDHDALAREAVARVHDEACEFQSAAFRRHGCYDGDTEHRIALAAIRLALSSQLREGRSPNKHRPSSPHQEDAA